MDEPSTIQAPPWSWAALLGRVALYGAVLAIPAWFGVLKVLAVRSDSSGAPFMFAMFFLPAAFFSALAVAGGCIAAFLLSDEAQRRARQIALTGSLIAVSTLGAVVALGFVMGRLR